MRPSRVLRTYCAIAFAVGAILSAPVAFLVHQGDLSANAAAILTLCWNVLFILTLPVIMDWSERKYCKARFVQLEELAGTNPELKAVLDAQCEKLSLPGLRLALVESAGSEAFTYGLWRQNPRLVMPASWLSSPEQSNIIPSIEVELNRFANRDVSIVFLCFGALQIALQFLLLTYVFH